MFVAGFDPYKLHGKQLKNRKDRLNETCQLGSVADVTKGSATRLRGALTCIKADLGVLDASIFDHLGYVRQDSEE